MDFDLLLRNGHIIDPSKRETFQADLAILDGKIAAIGAIGADCRAGQMIDVAGSYVTPALIDSHVHCYEHVGPGCLNPDRIGIRQGVGAVIDAGSFGPANAAGFNAYVAQRSTTRAYGLVNISRWGNSTNPGESAVIGFLNPSDVVRTIERAGGWIRGVKVRASVTAVGALGILPVHLAKQAAREAGVPVMVHIGNAPPTLDEVCSVLTQGDVITHCFHGKLGGIVTRQGAILPAVREAVDRGVLLDVGHGSASFAWSAAELAVALGYFPHTISTDLHRGCVDTVPGKSSRVTMASVMAKMLHLGMPLVDIVAASTLVPAQAFGLYPEFGQIAVGAAAHLSVIALVERPHELFDAEQKTRRLTQSVDARYTVLAGRAYEVDATAM